MSLGKGLAGFVIGLSSPRWNRSEKNKQACLAQAFSDSVCGVEGVRLGPGQSEWVRYQGSFGDNQAFSDAGPGGGNAGGKRKQLVGIADDTGVCLAPQMCRFRFESGRSCRFIDLYSLKSCAPRSYLMEPLFRGVS